MFIYIYIIEEEQVSKTQCLRGFPRSWKSWPLYALGFVWICTLSYDAKKKHPQTCMRQYVTDLVFWRNSFRKTSQCCSRSAKTRLSNRFDSFVSSLRREANKNGEHRTTSGSLTIRFRTRHCLNSRIRLARKCRFIYWIDFIYFDI